MPIETFHHSMAAWIPYCVCNMVGATFCATLVAIGQLNPVEVGWSKLVSALNHASQTREDADWRHVAISAAWFDTQRSFIEPALDKNALERLDYVAVMAREQIAAQEWERPFMRPAASIVADVTPPSGRSMFSANVWDEPAKVFHSFTGHRPPGRTLYRQLDASYAPIPDTEVELETGEWEDPHLLRLGAFARSRCERRGEDGGLGGGRGMGREHGSRGGVDEQPACVEGRAPLYALVFQSFFGSVQQPIGVAVFALPSTGLRNSPPLRVRRVVVAHGLGRRIVPSKNWSPFWHDGALHLLAALDPLVVLRCPGATADFMHSESARADDDFAAKGAAGDRGGGLGGVRGDDQLVCEVVHCQGCAANPLGSAGAPLRVRLSVPLRARQRPPRLPLTNSPSPPPLPTPTCLCLLPSADGLRSL